MTTACQSSFTPKAIEKDLPIRRVGKTCVVYDRLESTNDVLRSIMSDRSYDGLAVFANYQIAGRGRNGRSWQAAIGSSILCSVLLIFDGTVADLAGPVNLAAAIACADAVNHCFGLRAAIKWPNDIYIGRKKLGGILIESSQTDSSTAAFVVGMGLNVLQTEHDLPDELRESACSAAMALGRQLDQSDRLALARQLLIELDRTADQVTAGEFDQLRADWLALAADRDRLIAVEHEGRSLRGRIIDIDYRDNSLLVQDEAGLIWHLKPNSSRLVK